MSKLRTWKNCWLGFTNVSRSCRGVCEHLGKLILKNSRPVKCPESHGGTLQYRKIIFIHSFIGHFFFTVTTVLESQSNFIWYFPEYQNFKTQLKLLASMCIQNGKMSRKSYDFHILKTFYMFPFIFTRYKMYNLIATHVTTLLILGNITAVLFIRRSCVMY